VVGATVVEEDEVGGEGVVEEDEVVGT